MALLLCGYFMISMHLDRGIIVPTCPYCTDNDAMRLSLVDM